MVNFERDIVLLDKECPGQFDEERNMIPVPEKIQRLGVYSTEISRTQALVDPSMNWRGENH